MTKEQIENFSAGRHLDYVIVKEIWCNESKDGFLPNYSDSYDSWFIIDEIAKTHHWQIKSPFAPGEKWFAGLTPHGESGFNGRPDFQASGETMALAICRAALMMKFNYMT